MRSRQLFTGLFSRVALVLFQPLVLLVVLTLSTASSAETRSQRSPDKPTVVQVAIELNQLVDVDQKVENFRAVYTLRLRYKEPSLAFEQASDEAPYKMMTLSAF